MGVRTADRPASRGRAWVVRQVRALLGLEATSPAAAASRVPSRDGREPAGTRRLTPGAPPQPARHLAEAPCCGRACRSAGTADPFGRYTHSRSPVARPRPAGRASWCPSRFVACNSRAPVRTSRSRTAGSTASDRQERVDPLDEAAPRSGTRCRGPPSLAGRAMPRRWWRRSAHRASSRVSAESTSGSGSIRSGPRRASAGCRPSARVSMSSATGASKHTATAVEVSRTHTARAGLRRHRSPARYRCQEPFMPRCVCSDRPPSKPMSRCLPDRIHAIDTTAHDTPQLGAARPATCCASRVARAAPRGAPPRCGRGCRPQASVTGPDPGRSGQPAAQAVIRSMPVWMAWSLVAKLKRA